MSFHEVMETLEKAGSEQTRRTYARHGALEPMFGVSFATLKTLVKRIRVDHELALALWETGNHDARMLAIKVADPDMLGPSELDRWARESWMGMCGAYVSLLAADGPHGESRARAWLTSSETELRAAGWALVARLATMDESASDDWFLELLARMEATIHSAPNAERGAMNQAIITLGGRNAALRDAASAAAVRIGTVAVDHGDTACKTPDAVSYIAKTWTHALAKGFESPAAQERAREPMRTRC